MSQLLILGLPTPFRPNLPFCVSLLSKSAHDLTVSSGAESPSFAGTGSNSVTVADRVRADFG
ncbi:hypothetical protein ACTU45_27130 [Streptomyces sp. 24-1644]|uniref:hypothetical protein n=1 Tax=Streptomyces sp. 24-1644 TaxID=3457315 RepID=UPI003FA6DE69